MTRDEEYALYVGARWPTLVRAAILLGCSRADAQDLVQTVLIRCYVAWDKVSRAGNRDAYVHRMLFNAFKTSRRRRWRGEIPSEEIDRAAEADAYDEADLTIAVRGALRSLGDQGRAVVVLRYYLDVSERQTAELLGVPVGTVKSRLSRALAQLAADPQLIGLPGGESL